MRVPFEELTSQLIAILLNTGLSSEKAQHCARIFAENSRDGVHSHGLNRFPVFIKTIQQGLVDIHAEPELVSANGSMEQWDGNLAPGMYSAMRCMNRAVELAKENSIGCVAIRNTNHWMRGGTYGWQAAEQGCIAICATNACANMPAWGGIDPRLGNNPLVIAVPRSKGHIVLDLALSQFSYGKLQEYELRNQELPVAGGYDNKGMLTKDPKAISATRRTLPIGFWKGAGLSMLLDILVAGLSGGRSVAQISKGGEEYAVSQFFLCIDAKTLDTAMIEEIIAFTKESSLVDENNAVRYPGEQTLLTRKKSEQDGVEVNEGIWLEVKKLL